MVVPTEKFDRAVFIDVAALDGWLLIDVVRGHVVAPDPALVAPPVNMLSLAP
jgi:hypothetical protein